MPNWHPWARQMDEAIDRLKEEAYQKGLSENTDWVTAGERHEIEGDGHWHQPDYPSCVVCRMRDFEQQIDDLANFIMAKIPGEPSQNQGAVNTAIRLLREAYVKS